MLTTEWGNVRYPSCRDKGRMWGREGALCLSWWQRDPVGDFVEHKGRTPTRTSTRPPHPLHPAPCPYRTLGRKHLNGDVSAPILMNVDDRMGACRDKGRMWGRVGALCLS